MVLILFIVVASNNSFVYYNLFRHVFQPLLTVFFKFAKIIPKIMPKSTENIKLYKTLLPETPPVIIKNSKFKSKNTVKPLIAPFKIPLVPSENKRQKIAIDIILITILQTPSTVSLAPKIAKTPADKSINASAVEIEKNALLKNTKNLPLKFFNVVTIHPK